MLQKLNGFFNFTIRFSTYMKKKEIYIYIIFDQTRTDVTHWQVQVLNELTCILYLKEGSAALHNFKTININIQTKY